MGTVAFPNLGEHCSVESCKLVDFLPFTCDKCNELFCLEHRSYDSHSCPTANAADAVVLVCPLCAKAVRLVNGEDPNVTWDRHVSTSGCDPSNYQRATKKQRCPVPGCKEALTFSNKVRCKDCRAEVCLKHRFGPDHSCPASDPRKRSAAGSGSIRSTASAFGQRFLDNLSKRASELGIGSAGKGTSAGQPPGSGVPGGSGNGHQAHNGNVRQSGHSVKGAKGGSGGGGARSGPVGRAGNPIKLDDSTSSVRVAAVRRRQSDDSVSGAGIPVTSPAGTEGCPQCGAWLGSVQELIEHVESLHGDGARAAAASVVDVCPKCGEGFADPVALVEHVERRHSGKEDTVDKCSIS